jgi:hypothetical protein
MAITFSLVVVVGFSPAAAGELSPAAVTQLTERQFPHAGVPEIVNCRSASSVTSGYRREHHRMRNFNSSPIAAHAFFYVCKFATSQLGCRGMRR